MSKDADIIYRLNRRDEFIYLNEEWVNFAVANDASGLLPERVLGRLLWDFITDQTTEQIYREILDRVHTGRPMRFNFRCDAPEHRRYMEMTIARCDGGEAQFKVRTVRDEERPRQELLDRHAPRAGELFAHLRVV